MQPQDEPARIREGTGHPAQHLLRNGFQRTLASRNDIAVRTAMASNFLNGGVGYDIPADDIGGKGIGLETVK